MESLPRKAAENEWRHAKTQDIWKAYSKARGVGPATPILAHSMTPLHPAAGHVGTGLHVCLPVYFSLGVTQYFAIVLFLPLVAGIFAGCL